MIQLTEVNFDSVVGPTHHFGGLGVGNQASLAHFGQVAKPRAAALQGIEKMRRCAAIGAPQCILPPQRRPVLRMLTRLGYEGTTEAMLRQVAVDDPALLSAVWSASAMWTANAATVTASGRDGKTHLTVASLSSSLHRSLEPPQTVRLFRNVFQYPAFAVHSPLPSCVGLRDEGAANHMRLSDDSGVNAVDIFVYGSDDRSRSVDASRTKFFPRQTLSACQAVARLHRLDPDSTFFIRQHPEAIAAGAFHNDVVATSHRNVLLHHEFAYLDAEATLAAIEKRYLEVTRKPLFRYEVRQVDLSLDDAIKTYLFNCQLLSRSMGDKSTVMVCPMQVQEVLAARRVTELLVGNTGPIDECVFVELRESMNNGGGPACLRLRVPMTYEQWASIPEGIRWSDSIADELCQVIEQHYPETMTSADLANVELIAVADRAAAAVERVLGLDSLTDRIRE
jgi:succinylarginine dihydrolase